MVDTIDSDFPIFGRIRLPAGFASGQARGGGGRFEVWSEGWHSGRLCTLYVCLTRYHLPARLQENGKNYSIPAA